MSRIVHIGPGAFHRAHQAVYTQDAPDSWEITAVSLRSTTVVDALNAQNGKYTLVTRGANGTKYQQITSISEAIAAIRDRAAVLHALTRPETKVVSLTITEKGYAAPFGRDSAITLLVSALEHRRKQSLPAFTLLSCDNLANNGATLRDAVLEAAKPSELADWIARNARFPATMVDRITPATTAALRDEVAAERGWSDAIPVETEAFSQWVIEDDFAQSRPQWEVAGAMLVPDVAPYEHMKLRMLNGAHSMLAYAGHLSGKTYVREVMECEVLAPLVARHMNAAAATLSCGAGLDANQYRDDLLARFHNPRIAHETYQIAMDGSQKMPQRIFAPALDAIERRQDVTPFAFATAAWAKYLAGITDSGARFSLRDPREAELAALPSEPQDRIDALFALPALVPPKLAAAEPFRKACVALLRAATEHGTLGAIRTINA